MLWVICEKMSWRIDLRWLREILSHREVVTVPHSRQKSLWLSVSNKRLKLEQNAHTFKHSHPLSIKGWTVCCTLFSLCFHQKAGEHRVRRDEEGRSVSDKYQLEEIVPPPSLPLLPSHYHWPSCDLWPVHLDASSLPTLKLRRQTSAMLEVLGHNRPRGSTLCHDSL